MSNVTATPTRHELPFRAADFTTLTEALDYAAQGETGTNFYTGRGAIYASLTYSELRREALELARKLLGLGLEKGDRVALVAETNPDFVRGPDSGRVTSLSQSRRPLCLRGPAAAPHGGQ